VRITEIRVAGLRQQAESGVTAPEPDGMTPAETLAAIDRVVREQMHDMYACWNDALRPALEKEGIVFPHPEHLPPEVAEAAAPLPVRAPVAPRRPPAVADRAEPEAGDEADALRRVLETHRWQRGEAAAALGISRTTLWRRMRELGLLERDRPT